MDRKTSDYQTALKLYGFHRNTPGQIAVLAMCATAEEVKSAVSRLRAEGYVLTGSEQICFVR